MAKTATELLLKGVEMATNNGDRTEEIPDDAVADHIGPVEAYRHRQTSRSTTIDTTSQVPRSTPSHSGDSVAGALWLHSVAAVCRRGCEPLFIVRHRLLLKQCETHRLIHSDADGQTSARWLPLHRWRGDGHRGPAFPAQPQPAMHGPFLTKMLVSMAFAIWFMFSILRECIAAVWWQPPSSFTASAMASATLATRTTG